MSICHKTALTHRRRTVVAEAVVGTEMDVADAVVGEHVGSSGIIIKVDKVFLLEEEVTKTMIRVSNHPARMNRGSESSVI